MTTENAGQREIDRSKWPRGPWDGEPDRIEFEHAGLPCLMRRNGSGAWCGYAAVPPGHPLHGKGYSELYDYETDSGVEIDAHGGLTYAGACGGDICHVPKPGEPDNVWWFGFDCAHGDDLIPAYDRSSWGEPHASYKAVPYVRAEVGRLAEQLAAQPSPKASP